jgi:hypothetical protein
MGKNLDQYSLIKKKMANIIPHPPSLLTGERLLLTSGVIRVIGGQAGRWRGTSLLGGGGNSVFKYVPIFTKHCKCQSK